MEKRRTVLGYFFRAMWNHRKSFYFFYVLYVGFMIGLPLVNIFCPRLIIDEISTSKDMQRIVTITILMIAIGAVVGTAVVLLENQMSKIYYVDLNRHLEANIGKKSMELKYEVTENKRTLDYISDAKLGIQNAYSGGMSGMFSACSLLLSNIGVLLISAIVVLGCSWLLMVIVVINVVVSTRMNKKLNDIQLAQFEKLSFIDRGYYFLLHSLSDICFGQDIRLFRAKDIGKFSLLIRSA